MSNRTVDNQRGNHGLVSYPTLNGPVILERAQHLSDLTDPICSRRSMLVRGVSIVGYGRGIDI